jgi:preprotein translocase subunit SecF
MLLGAISSLLLFSGGRVAAPSRLLAQIGIAVGIAPNPYNTLNEQLQQQQTELNQQAADLAAREAAFASSTGAATAAESPVIWYLAIAIAIIGILVFLNFYFEWQYFRRTPKGPPEE